MARLFKRGKTFYVTYAENGKQVRRSLKTGRRDVAEKLFAQIQGELAGIQMGFKKGVVLRESEDADTVAKAFLRYVKLHARENEIHKGRKNTYEFVP